MAAPTGPAPDEWPRLDLAKHHITRLALAWTVPYAAEVTARFAELLDEDGSFAGVLAYTRRKVRHYRVEAAQLAATEDEAGALLVTVQYQADTGALLEIPKSLQDRAWLLTPLQSLAPDAPVLCHADAVYGISPRLATTPSLPIRPPEDEPSPTYDEIYGVRGVRHSVAGDPSLGYTFSLDRLPAGDVVLALDFVLAAGLVAEMPARALDLATFFAGFLVQETRA